MSNTQKNSNSNDLKNIGLPSNADLPNTDIVQYVIFLNCIC